MPRGRLRRRVAHREDRERNRQNARQAAQPQQNEDNHPRMRGRKRNADEVQRQDDNAAGAERHVGAQGQTHELDAGDNRLLQDDADVCVLGDSIPYWTGKQAKATGKPNLRLDNKIVWWRIWGLRWNSFRHSMQSQALLSPPPAVIVIHLGGNDLHSLSVCKIKRSISSEIRYLREAFTNTMIIWVDILPRRAWRGDFSLKLMDAKRKRVNRLGRTIVHKFGKSDIISPDIDTKTNFFRADGVHLNEVGLEFYLDFIRESLLKNRSSVH